MSWTYAAFDEEATETARLTMLRQHIGEIRQAMGAKLGHDGKYRDPSTLVEYLKLLESRRRELEAATGDTLSADSPAVRNMFVRGNPR